MIIWCRVEKIPKFKEAKELLAGIKHTKTSKNNQSQTSDITKNSKKKIDFSKHIRTFKAIEIHTPLDHISENSINESKFS